MITTLDTETCGLYGMPVLLQYAHDNDPHIHLHEFWTQPVKASLDLIERIADTEVIGFNLAFDWFHLCKAYTTFRLLNPDERPTPKAVAAVEREAMRGPCLKPRTSFDVMLHARKTDLQMTMERSNVRIRRVPVKLASDLAAELEKSIEFDEILFTRRANKLAPKWSVRPVTNKDGSDNPDFKTLLLKFQASSALKAMAVHVLKVDPSEVIVYSDIELGKKFYPKELGYAPYAAATRANWTTLIQFHIDHWRFSERARLYAMRDVDYTRRLYHHFGSPDRGDDDSELATLVAAVRWRGYKINIDGFKGLQAEAESKIKQVPTAGYRVKEYFREVLSEDEKATFTSTRKVVLEKMVAHAEKIDCPKCVEKGLAADACKNCNKTGSVLFPESAQRAADVLDTRKLQLQKQLYKKLIHAGRFHASYKIIGALSSRMSGADGLNPQGINRVTEVRQQFELADDGLVLWGGDFSGFEVVLADAAYNDPLLRKDLMTCERCRDCQVIGLDKPAPAKDVLSADTLLAFIAHRLKDEDSKEAKAISKGKSYTKKTGEQIANETLRTFACPKCGDNKRMKIHALFGVHVYPPMTYDDIKATDGKTDDKYNKSKSAVFAMIYGGEAYTLMTRLGVALEVAQAAYERFISRYVGVGKARQRVIKAFMSLKQMGGAGSAIKYHDPEEYVESLLGFRRYFTLENRIVKALVKMAEDLPEALANIRIPVNRSGRIQYASGAVQSALYGCAFQIQAANMRAAANHEIQSSGAQITKRVQRRIWDLQPHGVNPWYVQPCNIHDQVLTPTHPDWVDKVNAVVFETVESFRDRVPLIELEWKRMETWASK